MGNGKQGVEKKVCIPSLGTGVPTVKTPNWSYSSWRCYHTPKCATHACMCLTSPRRVAAINGLCCCRTEGASQVLVPLLWRPISVLAPNLWGNGKSPTYERGRVAKCAKGIQNAQFSRCQKLTHSPARVEGHAEQVTPLHCTHYCQHQPSKVGGAQPHSATTRPAFLH